MAAREYYYNESLTRATSTNTTFTASTASITQAFTNAQKYAIFWCAYIDTATTFTGRNKARLQNVTAGTTIAEINITPEATTARVSVGGAELYTGTGVSTQIQIQYCSPVGTTTTGLSESSLMIIAVGASDVAAESTGDTASSSTSYLTKVSTGSFGTAGDYLIVGSAKVLPGASGAPKIQITDGTTPLGVVLENDDTSEIRPYFALRKVTLAAAATHTLDFAVVSGTHTIRNARIFAFRMSGFDNYYWGEDRTQHTIAATDGYHDSSCAVSATPQNLVHFIVASGTIADTTGTQATFLANKINDGAAGAGTDIGTIFSTISANVTLPSYSFWIAQRRITPAAAAKTWTTRYSRTSGTATMGSDEHVLAVLQLDASAVSPTGKNLAFSTGVTPVLSPAGI